MWQDGTEDRRRQYDREWYASRSDEWKRKKIERDTERRRQIKAVIAEYKRGHACACGESHPACLEFHHRSDDKEINVADAVRAGWAVARIMAEIEKCVLICANCHRKAHHADE